MQEFENESGSYSEIVSIFETVFGIDIGSSEFCAAIEMSYLESPDNIECEGISISQALEAVRRRIQDLHTEPEGMFGRENGLIYITGHKVMHTPMLHMAIEYRDPVTKIASTLSAAPTLTEWPVWRLKSDVNRASDAPIMNRKIAEVIPPVGFSAESYFIALVASDSKYRDCLQYDLRPEGTPELDYNSNSYVAGILAQASATIDFTSTGYSSMSQFWGGSVPVPAIEFTESAPDCPE